MKAITFCCAIIFLMSSGCSLFYVAKQGIYQIKLISDAEPIENALRSHTISIEERKKLMLILDVRDFATKHLYLDVHKNYKDVNLSWHHVIHTVSASKPLAFTPYQWWFPIIGSVPYKGFFDIHDAEKEALWLNNKGYETIVRPISGYSTLGFFPDPVWPSMLQLSDFSLIELIIHELTHATIYIPNQTPFNETLANFVGVTGARRYVEYRSAMINKTTKEFDDHQKRQIVYRNFFYQLYEQLRNVYEKNTPELEKISEKNKLLLQAKINYEKLITHEHLKEVDWSEINNASLLSFKRYNYDDAIFSDLLKAKNGNFADFIEEVRYQGHRGDPFLSLKNYLETKKRSL